MVTERTGLRQINAQAVITIEIHKNIVPSKTSMGHLLKVLY
jgi:hypothetical protein